MARKELDYEKKELYMNISDSETVILEHPLPGYD
jgi:hypothetical protein